MRRSTFFSLKFSVAILICSSAPLLSAPPRYQLVDLGTMGGDITYAIDINNKGEIAGYGNLTAGGLDHAFRTRPNQPINLATDDLGTRPGSHTVVTGINDSGTVIGRFEVAGNPHAFRIPAGRLLDPVADDLGTLGGLYSEATGINSSGQISG